MIGSSLNLDRSIVRLLAGAGSTSNRRGTRGSGHRRAFLRIDEQPLVIKKSLDKTYSYELSSSDFELTPSLSYF